MLDLQGLDARKSFLNPSTKYDISLSFASITPKIIMANTIFVENVAFIIATIVGHRQTSLELNFIDDNENLNYCYTIINQSALHLLK